MAGARDETNKKNGVRKAYGGGESGSVGAAIEEALAQTKFKRQLGKRNGEKDQEAPTVTESRSPSSLFITGMTIRRAAVQ